MNTKKEHFTCHIFHYTKSGKRLVGKAIEEIKGTQSPLVPAVRIPKKTSKSTEPKVVHKMLWRKHMTFESFSLTLEHVQIVTKQRTNYHTATHALVF